jgi:hypothetical protein
MKKIALTSLVLLSLTSIANAASHSSDIDLGSTYLSPKQSFTFSLAKLTPNVAYDVFCRLSFNMYADVNLYTNADTSYLDGQKISGNILKLQKDHYASGYDLDIDVTSPAMQSLEFTNLDDTANINLVSCVAKAK